MSKPANENSTEKGNLQFFLWILKYTIWQHQKAMLPQQFKSGGIVAGEVHQGETIINRKSGFYCPPPNFVAQPKCKNVLNKSQSDALYILKNINQLKK